MVTEQLASRGISDERVLAAMGEIPRERFVPPELVDRAYEDGALAIGHEQTISQPWIVAAICQGLLLEGSETVLEIGTGSGYSTAVLAALADRVISIERIGALSAAAAELLGQLGVGGVELIVGDGSRGYPAEAPYDAIAVHAAVPDPPRTLIGQLAHGGSLVAPLTSGHGEYLTQIVRGPRGGDAEEEFSRRQISACRFVPLIGAEGFPER